MPVTRNTYGQSRLSLSTGLKVAHMEAKLQKAEGVAVEWTDYIRLQTKNQKDSRRRSDQYANEYFKESKLEIN